MDLIDQLQALSARLQKQIGHIHTEEATKNALVLPFINALGYNVFDPTEVVPEFTSDVGTKKGEKVDYAICRDGIPLMLFECKHAGGDLNLRHASQLFRYFHVTPVRVGVLTNGIVYRFFSDLEELNKMDERPFLEFDVRDIRESAVTELKKLTKATFDVDELVSAASELKYTNEIKRILGEQLEAPDKDLVRFFAAHVHGGRFTQSVQEQFSTLVQRAFRQFINERISQRLQQALDSDQAETSEAVVEQEASESDDGIETTEEEMEGFRIVRAIVSDTVDPARVAHRDVKSYFGILLDDNNRKPICRLHFNTSQKYVELFDTESREKHSIGDLVEIYRFADRLRASVARYESE